MSRAIIRINAVDGSNRALPLNVVVNLSNNGDGNEATYLWSIQDKPEGSAAALSSTTAAAPTFTPDLPGSYLVRLVTDDNLATEDRDQVIAGVLRLRTATRTPAAGETVEASAARGWAEDRNRSIALIEDRLAGRGNIEVCRNASGLSLAPGTIVVVTGTADVGNGLLVPTFVRASAAVQATCGAVGVLLGTLDAAANVADAALGRVCFGGLVSGIDLTGAAAQQVGYVADAAGTHSLTAGTVTRSLGFAVTAGAAGVLYVHQGGIPEASLISYDGGPAWKDGTTNPATNVEAQLDKIVTDLVADAGAARVGAAARTAWLGGRTNPAVSIFAAIDKIITDLAVTTATDDGAERIGITARSAWKDATANAASDVSAAIEKIIVDLVADAGAARVGAAARGAWKDATTNPAVSVFAAIDKIITDLSADAGALKIGVTARALWRDGTTNPTGVSVHAALDKIVVDLEAAAGADRIGCAARTAWLGGRTNPAPISIFGAIDKIITDLADVSAGDDGAERIGAAPRSNWKDATTNPAAGVSAALEKIIVDLIADAGAARLGCGARTAWLGGRTNPTGVSILAAIDKIITDLAVTSSGDDGAERVGAQAVTGSLNNLLAGSVRSQLDELLGDANTHALDANLGHRDIYNKDTTSANLWVSVVAAFPVPNNGVLLLEADVTAIIDDGSGDFGYGEKIQATYRNKAGAVSLVGAQQSPYKEENFTATPGSRFAISGTNIGFEVNSDPTGAGTGVAMTWKVGIRVLSHS